MPCERLSSIPNWFKTSLNKSYVCNVQRIRCFGFFVCSLPPSPRIRLLRQAVQTQNDQHKAEDILRAGFNFPGFFSKQAALVLSPRLSKGNKVLLRNNVAPHSRTTKPLNIWK